MATVWITFATEDNLEGDIDYLAQEISRCGWKTRMHPMFPNEDEKIDRLMPAFLAKPDQSDAWILFGSARALEHGRAARIEGVIQRALGARGPFPAIGLFPELTGAALALSHRIGSQDLNWRDQLGSALGCDLTERPGGASPPYVAHIHVLSEGGDYRYAFECRPKMGRWDAFIFAVPPEDMARVAPQMSNDEVEEGFSDDAEWYFQIAKRAGTSTRGFSVLLRELPSRLAFGQEGLNEAVILELRATH